MLVPPTRHRERRGSISRRTWLIFPIIKKKKKKKTETKIYKLYGRCPSDNKRTSSQIIIYSTTKIQTLCRTFLRGREIFVACNNQQRQVARCTRAATRCDIKGLNPGPFKREIEMHEGQRQRDRMTRNRRQISRESKSWMYRQTAVQVGSIDRPPLFQPIVGSISEAIEAARVTNSLRPEPGLTIAVSQQSRFSLWK